MVTATGRLLFNFCRTLRAIFTSAKSEKVSSKTRSGLPERSASNCSANASSASVSDSAPQGARGFAYGPTAAATSAFSPAACLAKATALLLISDTASVPVRTLGQADPCWLRSCWFRSFPLLLPNMPYESLRPAPARLYLGPPGSVQRHTAFQKLGSHGSVSDERFLLEDDCQ